MTELTLRHKRILGNELLDVDDDAFSDMVVPSEMTPEIAAFAAELSPLPPQLVPRVQDEDATYGWPADGVRARVERDGGDIRFGWRLRQWPNMMLMAVFHAVWIDPQGTPIDITPDVVEGDFSLFVPASPEGEPAQPPVPRYRITRVRPDASVAIAERIARLKTGQRAYEERRAAKAGQTLEERFNDKYHPDRIASLLSTFVGACEQFDANLPTLSEFISSEPSALEPHLQEASQISNDLDDAVTLTDSQGASTEAANSATGNPSEPGSEPAVAASLPDESPQADQDDDEDYDLEAETTRSELWAAIEVVGAWSGSRRVFRKAIGIMMRES